MATIVTRAGKGSPLTNNEVDANFVNINNELGTKTTLPSQTGNNGKFLTTDGTNPSWATLNADPAGTAVALAIALG
jgi:hypothetical protein